MPRAALSSISWPPSASTSGSSAWNTNPPPWLSSTRTGGSSNGTAPAYRASTNARDSSAQRTVTPTSRRTSCSNPSTETGPAGGSGTRIASASGRTVTALAPVPNRRAPRGVGTRRTVRVAVSGTTATSS